MQVDPQSDTNISGLIPKNSGKILAVMITGNRFDCFSNSLAGSLESEKAGSSVWEQTVYSNGDTENYSVEEVDSSVQGGEESSVEAHDRTESPILEQENNETLQKEKRSVFTEQPLAVGVSAPSAIQMTVLPEWVTLSENSRQTTLVDITSKKPRCLEIQGKDLASLEMPYPEKITEYSNEFDLPSPTILSQIGFPDTFSSHVLAGDITQKRESFVELLSRMHGQGFSLSTHFTTDYHSVNSATDPGIEYAGNLSSVNFSFVGSNGQTFSLLAADKSRDSLEVIESGSNLVDLCNADIHQQEQFYKKIRLSTLRSQIRGSGRSACWYGNLDDHYKQGQFEYPPQKHTKRKKHRPRVVREPRPVRNFHERKKQSQTTKEKTSSVDRECASVHEIFASEPNMQDNLGYICSSCDTFISGVHSCVALKKYGNCGFDYWQASSCFGSSQYLDRSSDFLNLPSAARDQNRDTILSSQEEGSLSYMLSNRGMDGSLCDGFHNMHEQKSNNSISSGAELTTRGKSGVTREDGVELSLQLKEQAIVEQMSTASCSQMEIEKTIYPWNMDDIIGSMPWLYETQSTNIDRNSHACMANTMIDFENESIFPKYIPNVNTSEGVPCYDLMGGVRKTQLNHYLHTVDGWKDAASQSCPFNNGECMNREESLCCTKYSNLLQAHPCSVHKPESEVSSISSITNPTQLDGQGIQLSDRNCLQIVPYQNKEIVLSRRGREKHRPKVQLDTETNRVWGLLENGGALPPEEDQEKARMWAKERAVMEERADYFITRMHDVQGDRRFSQWKGSLVDSIVGVFLTQNVSDHLSSSAFMSLASRFPASPRNAASDVQETRNIAHSDIVRISNGQSVAVETVRIDDQSLLAQSIEKGQSVALATMRIGDESLMTQCPDGQPIITEAMRIDMVECKFKNEESNSNDAISSTSETFDDPYIGNPLQYSPLQLHPFYGDRTQISERVRRRLDFEQNDILGKQHQISLVIRKDPLSSCAEQTVHSQENYDCMDNNLVVLSQEMRDYPETEATLLVNHKTCLKPNSELQTVQAPDSVIMAPGKGKKKLYKVSRISGIERAQIEVSQGGHKNRKKDWESMRQQVLAISGDETRKSTFEQGSGSSHQDVVNWEAVRLADIANVADAIKERGMHNILSGRIKAFLTTLHEEHGSINLEWVRGLSVEDAREYLLDIRGLGIKSVECIRLLTLQHLAFPVDTNVGRICVRLGWVPIEPLPEELQLHLLELYPVQEKIQKYLWPRLCTLDQRTLYELHYQMITFGKVFCTKSKPNCNSCPMRGECKHFASAYASSKLSLTSSSATHPVNLLSLPGPSIEADKTSTSVIEHEQLQPTFQQIQICEPIIEEPTTPVHECTEYISDIEDCHSIYSKPSDYSDPVYLENFSLIELPSEERAFELLGEQGGLAIHFQGACCSRIASEGNSCLYQSFASDLTLEGPSCQSQSTVSDLTSERDSIQSGFSVMEFTSGKGLYESQSIIPDVPSNAIVPLPLEYAYLPVPKLKNIGRLRTVHYVYEIPDDHHLIREMDTREKDDPCFYLLAIWSPDEVPQSQDEIDNCCSKDFCTSPYRTTFGQDESVKGTLLIPCRTATHGSFPLNGTFFQVNEVFADHKSSLHPLEVPRSWLWNLRRRFVYFGTSIPSIFRGLSTEEIKLCFWRGHVCVRGFDRESRAPKPLVARLHFPASKQTKAPKNQTKKEKTEKILSDHV